MGRQIASRERSLAASSGNRIREFRLARGWRADELAERVGTTQSTISRLEAGTRGLTVDWLRRVALALGVRAGDLIDEDNGVRYATVLGGLFEDETVPPAVLGMMHSPDSRYLITIPKAPATDRPVEAFEIRDGYIYCEEVFPTADDLQRTFVILFRPNDMADLLSMRILEQDGTRIVLYSKSAPPSHRTFQVGDKRVLRTWRALSMYRELRAATS